MTITIRSLLPWAKPRFDPEFARVATRSVNMIAASLQAISNAAHNEKWEVCSKAAAGLKRCVDQGNDIKLAARLSEMRVAADSYTRSSMMEGMPNKTDVDRVDVVNEALKLIRHQLLSSCGRIAVDAGLLMGRLSEFVEEPHDPARTAHRDLKAAALKLQRSAARGEVQRLQKYTLALAQALQRWDVEPGEFQQEHRVLIQEAAMVTLRSAQARLSEGANSRDSDSEHLAAQLRKCQDIVDRPFVIPECIPEGIEEPEKLDIPVTPLPAVVESNVIQPSSTNPTAPTAGLPGAAAPLVKIAGQVRDLVLKWWHKLVGH